MGRHIGPDRGKGRHSGPKRSWMLTLDPELAQALDAYHRNTGMDGNIQDSMRDLMRLALASDPLEAGRKAATLRVFNSTRYWVLATLKDKLVEIEEALNLTLQQVEAESANGED
jgi:hypothetical protein